jgi:uncharacterized membrane protein
MKNRIRNVSVGFAFLGLLDSLYLTWVKYSGQYATCGPIGDCESVNNSPYAEIAGIPIALLGSVTYLLVIILLLLEIRGSFWEGNSPSFVFGLSLVGVLYSIYLTYLEVAVLRAICPYCLISAGILVVLLVLSSVRLWRGLSELSAVS